MPDVIVIGAGAAGLMCAATASQRGKRVLVLDHSKKIAEKIRISGGGRCNFTNIHCSPKNFLSQNPHFCKSALSQYTPQDFINLVERHGIRYHEKTLGQLFCDSSSQQIIDMLLDECDAGHVETKNKTLITSVTKTPDGFTVNTQDGSYECHSLVIATGGLSIPKIGASSFGYDVAKQFDIPIVPTRPALVPLTFSNDMLEICKTLSGLSVEASVSHHKTTFEEGLLFTHRGLSGPSILQISSYWNEGDCITVDLAKDTALEAVLMQAKRETPLQTLNTILSRYLPKRLVQLFNHKNTRLGETSDKTLQKLAQSFHQWNIKPDGTEGYRTAEVTLGGIDTNNLSSKTMESKTVPALYFIGEVVDVTGHLGGHNFQWAWSSAHAAAISVSTSR